MCTMLNASKVTKTLGVDLHMPPPLPTFPHNSTLLRALQTVSSMQAPSQPGAKKSGTGSTDLNLLLEACTSAVPCSFVKTATDKKRCSAVKVKKARANGLESGSLSGGGRWSQQEDELLKEAVRTIGPRNWKRVAAEFLNNKRTDVQCLHRWQKVLKPGLVKGPWTKEEDETIIRCRKEGITKWSEIARRVTGRIGKQCRERWFNHLDPSIRKCEWTEEEDRKLIEGQLLLGNKWSQIAKLYLPGRPENAVKNRWNAATRKRRVKNKKRKLKADEVVEDGTSIIRGAHKIDIVTEHTKPLTKTQARFLALRPKKDMKAMGDAMEAMVSLCKSPSPRKKPKTKALTNKKSAATATSTATTTAAASPPKREYIEPECPKPIKKRAIPSRITVPEVNTTKATTLFTTPKAARNLGASISPSHPQRPMNVKADVDVARALQVLSSISRPGVGGGLAHRTK